MKKFLAFTLSEVLVTVGIIGVIAALTVPNLVKNYQKQAQTVQLRKTINELEDALDLLITEEGKTSLAQTSFVDEGGIANFFNNHLRVIKTCSSTNTSSCFANQNYISINGSQNLSFTCSGNSYVLADSSTVCASRITSVPIEAEKDGVAIEGAFQTAIGYNVELYIDTNGAQAPNIGGRDMFHVYVRPDGKIADTVQVNNNICTMQDDEPVCVAPSSDDSIVIKPGRDCVASALGTGCLTNILNNNWNMNY